MFKTVDIDFEVYKALTSLLATETSTYNDVIRSVLGLPPADSPTPVAPSGGGWTWKGMTLPNGTELRAYYKGQTYVAAITNGQWVQDGTTYTSPSAAGFTITQAGLNGWTFWSAKRPSDAGWTVLDHLRTEAKAQHLRSAA